MADSTHLEEHLQRDIANLRDRLGSMADLVVQQLEDAVSAFADGNRQLAYTVVMRDHQVDVFEQHIDRLCQEFLVRHMPVAKQLRFVLALVKTNNELERIGDYAEAIARRAVTLADSDNVPEREKIVEMAKHAFQMLRHSIDAFITDDADLAMRTLESDRAVDDMNSKIFNALATAPVQSDDLTSRFALLGLVNRVERVADRACNIAEGAVYVSKGEVLRHLPREDIRVLFLCDHNSRRSQMAEGIAREIAAPNFIFSSAGTEPQPVDPKAVAFLASKGIDISRQRSKGLDAVGPIQDFHVVVTLSTAAEEALPPVPYHAVALNWEIRDPGRAETEDEAQAAYGEAYEKLTRKINDMTEGLVGAFERGVET